MATITKPKTFVDGTVPKASDFNQNFDTIYNEFNGNIDNSNIKPNAGIEGSKLAAGIATPPGVIASFAGSSVPSGWLLCDGSAVSRTTYSDLFAAIGTTYGAGNGTTTFNLPNLKGKVITGYDSAQTEFNTLGKTGGEKTHTLTTGEMPIHNHGVNDPGHNHESSYNSGGGAAQPASAWSNTAKNEYNAVVKAAGTGISIQNAGSNAAHNNLQPYITLNYIIKT